MALINTTKTAFFINAASGDLPVPPAGFVEASEPTLFAPEFESIEYRRITGKLNTKETIIDTCAAAAAFEMINTMRSSNVAADALATPPEYGLLLKSAGFEEIIDTTTPGQETVTYVNGTDSMPKSSVLLYLDGNKFEFTDSLVCGIGMEFERGNIAKMTASYNGYVDSPIPVDEDNPAVTPSSEPPLIVSCADIFTVGGDCIPLTKVSISMNPEVQNIYTIGGTCGIKQAEISDYALEIVAEFYVDSDTFDREPTDITDGTFKAIEIKLGLDSNSDTVNGKSVVLTADLSKTILYEDSEDKNYVKRTVTYRLMDGATSALSIKHGYFS